MLFAFFMKPNVCPDGLCRDFIPHRADKIPIFPKLPTPQLLVHSRKFRPNDLGTHRFTHLYYPGNGIFGREGEKEMHMVFINLHLDNFEPMMSGNLLKHLLHPSSDRTVENPFPIFRSPH